MCRLGPVSRLGLWQIIRGFGFSIVGLVSPSPTPYLELGTLSLTFTPHTGHIEWHLEVGLAVTFIEAPLIAQSRASNVSDPYYTGPLPSALNEQCETLGFATSGNAVGKASTTDLEGLPSGPYEQNNGWHAKGIWAMFGWVFFCFPPPSSLNLLLLPHIPRLLCGVFGGCVIC